MKTTNTEYIDLLIEKFYDATISRSEREHLYRYFLNNAGEAQNLYPQQSKVILPLAMAYMAHKGKRQAMKLTAPRKSKTLWPRVAAAATIVIIVTTILIPRNHKNHNPEGEPMTYCSAEIISTEVEQHLQNTLTTLA
jgi:hypothetical protein